MAIIAHEGDVKHYTREAPMTFCSTGWFGRLFLKTGLILQPYTASMPDILLANDDLISLLSVKSSHFVNKYWNFS